MREPDVDRERDAAPAAPAQLTVMSSGSAARPGPEGPSGIVRVEPETRSERVESRSWASEPHYRRWAHSHLGCGRAGGTPSASVDASSALKVTVENSVGLRPTLPVKVRASGPH